MKKLIFFFAVAIALSACNSGGGNAKKAIPLNTKADTISYLIGSQIGQPVYILNQDDSTPDINMDIVYNAAYESSIDQSRIEEADARLYMQELSTMFRAAQQKQAEAEGLKNLSASEDYLEANKAKEGVVTTESGLQYKIITEGTGATPQATDKVKVHYRGTLMDGTEFDSSYKRGEPIEFALNGVIKGWTEGLQTMKVGGKSELYIHPELGYGTRASGSIPPNSALIFQVELLDIVTEAEK